MNHTTVTSGRYGVYRHGLHYMFGEMGQELGSDGGGGVGHARKDRENDGAGRKSGKTA